MITEAASQFVFDTIHPKRHQALRAALAEPTIVLTVPGLGYRLAA